MPQRFRDLSDFDREALTWVARIGLVDTPQLVRLTHLATLVG